MTTLGSLGLDSSNNDTYVVIDSGRDLALALSNQLVSDIVVAGSITLKDDDWNGLGELPVILRRNVTVRGSPELVAIGDLPAINFSFVKNKVKLPGNTILNLTGVFATCYREDLPSSNPGMDLLAHSTDTSGPPPMLLLYKMAINNRLCFPEGLSRKSVESTKRPDALPGTQNVTFDLPQPGCRHEDTGPWLTRCYAAHRRYEDVGAYAASYSATGSFERSGYLAYAYSADLLCSEVMTDGCIAKFGAVGCYYSVFPKNKNATTTPTAQQQAPPVALQQVSASPADGDDASKRRRRTVLIAVLCSTLGAAVVITAIVGALVLLWKRRPRSLGDKQLAEERSGHSRWAGKAHDKHRRGSDGRGALDESGSSEGADEAAQLQNTFRLDVTAPGLGGEPLPVARGEPGGIDLEAATAGVAVGNQLADHPPRRQLTAAHPGDAPVTLKTPPRPDMHLLSDPFRPAVDDEVKLLPNTTRGVGSFGRVVEGVFQGQRVAVKLVADVYQWGGPSATLLRSFAQEVEVLCRCAHPNVVRLLAACLTPPRVCLVMELMETSLERVMYPTPCKPALLPITTVLHVALEVAKGLEYLHPTIVHRDLKPANVLINDPSNLHPVVKLTDFGVSRLRSTEAPTLTPDAGTPAYLAPEGLDPMNNVITHKADIYSLAIMLWEMVAGEQPWRDCNVMEMAIRVVLQGGRPALEDVDEARCPLKLRQLIVRCWDRDPRRRPAAAEVAKSVTLIIQEREAAARPAGAVAVATAAAGGAAGGGDAPVVLVDLAVAAAATAVVGEQQQRPSSTQSGPRILEQEADTVVVAEVAEAEDRVSPETVSMGAAPAAAAKGETLPCPADGAAVPPLAPPPPPKHLPGERRREGGDNAAAALMPLAVFIGKGVAVKANKPAAKGAGDGQQPPPQPPFQDRNPGSCCSTDSAYPYTLYSGPRACAVGFLDSSAFKTGHSAASRPGPEAATPAADTFAPLVQPPVHGATTASVLRVPPALVDRAPTGTC